MGPYGTLVQELECLVTQESSERKIQAKWVLDVKKYGIGDDSGFAKHMRELWIKDDYTCGNCEQRMDKKYPGWRAIKRISFPVSPPNSVPDWKEYSHDVFILLKYGIITEIITEKEFLERRLEEFIDASALANSVSGTW